MLRSLGGLLLFVLAGYALAPVLRGCLEILLSPRKDILFLITVSTLVVLECAGASASSPNPLP